MSSIQEDIIRVLRENGNTPMKALDIAKKIDPSYTKKPINQAIYHMKETEKAEPIEQPPKWKLKEQYMSAVPQQRGASVLSAHEVPKLDSAVGGSPAVVSQVARPSMTAVAGRREEEIASPNANVVDHILEILKFKTEGVSCEVIAKALGMPSPSVLIPLLDDLQKRGLIKSVKMSSEQKPLWKLVNERLNISPQSNSQTNEETVSSQTLLYKRSDLPDGTLQFTPQHSSDGSLGSTSASGSVSYPTQETLSGSTGAGINSTETQAPVQESLTNQLPGSSTMAVEQTQSSENALNNASQSKSKSANAAPSPKPTSGKKKVKIAANFKSSPPVGNASERNDLSVVTEESDLKAKVLLKLKTGKGFSALQLSKLLASNTGLTEEITKILVTLREEGLAVEESKDVWRLK